MLNMFLGLLWMIWAVLLSRTIIDKKLLLLIPTIVLIATLWFIYAEINAMRKEGDDDLQ